MECNGTLVLMMLLQESFLFHLQEVQQPRSFLLIRSCNQTCASSNFVTTEAPNPGLTMADLVLEKPHIKSSSRSGQVSGALYIL